MLQTRARRLVRAVIGVGAIATSLGSAGVPALSLRPHFLKPPLILVRSVPPNSVNPFLAENSTAIWLDSLIFQSLVSIRHGRLVPDLSQHWVSLHHGQVWHITLNPRAKWWDGRPVTARDVSWSYQVKLQRFLPRTAPLAALHPAFQPRGLLALTVRLRRPDPFFLRQFASHGPVSWILPAFLFRKSTRHTLLTTPYLNDPVDMVGSGPYRLLRLTHPSARLAANLHYYLGVPKAKVIVVRFRSPGQQDQPKPRRGAP